MKPRGLRIAIALAGILTPAGVGAQHEGHQSAALQPSAQLTQCAQIQPAVDNIIAAATARLETARQSNDPAQMRAAVDHLQGALRDLRTQLAPCAAAGTAADPHTAHATPPSTKPTTTPDPHAGHTMPSSTTTPKATTSKPAVADPHAGHEMPAAKSPAPKTTKPASPPDAHAGHGAPPKRAAPTTKPKPSPADPHAGHQAGAAEETPEKQMDPVTGLMVDPSTAPKTTYQGQTYYFSSEASKKEFLENPAKFARKPKR